MKKYIKYYILLALFAVSACVGISAPSQFYTINPINNTFQAQPQIRANIGIEVVKIPQYLDKPQIVTRDSNQVELNISEFHRWSEPLGDAMQTAIADNLSVYLPNSIVKPTSFRQEQFDYLVWIEVNRFDATFGQEATLSAWWSIYNGKGKVLLQGRTNLQQNIKTTYDDLAIKYSHLVAQLSAEVAQKITKLKK